MMVKDGVSISGFNASLYVTAKGNQTYLNPQSQPIPFLRP